MVKPNVTKSSAAATASPAATGSAVPPTKVLTVVVLDTNSQPVQGASVTLSPSDQSAVTDSSGEVHFTLGTVSKYDVTATADGKTATVPYYVTRDGATRLVINPVYVKTVEVQREQSSVGGSFSGYFIGGIVIIVAAYVLWRFIKRK